MRAEWANEHSGMNILGYQPMASERYTQAVCGGTQN
jgi:hypothetical protein